MLKPLAGPVPFTCFQLWFSTFIFVIIGVVSMHNWNRTTRSNVDPCDERWMNPHMKPTARQTAETVRRINSCVFCVFPFSYRHLSVGHASAYANEMELFARTRFVITRPMLTHILIGKSVWSRCTKEANGAQTFNVISIAFQRSTRIEEDAVKFLLICICGHHLKDTQLSTSYFFWFLIFLILCL